MALFDGFTYGSGNIRGRVFDLYARATTTFAAPADAAAHTTLLSSFTKIGALDTGVECKSEDGPTRDTTEGVKMLFRNIVLNAVLNEVTVANIDDFIAADRNQIDILLVEQVGEAGDMCIALKNVPFHFRFALVGGGNADLPINVKKAEENPGDVIEWYAIPAAVE